MVPHACINVTIDIFAYPDKFVVLSDLMIRSKIMGMRISVLSMLCLVYCLVHASAQ